MDQPRVTVIMTCYKGEKWIGKSIESVLNQDYQDLEILIVNDDSPDDSARVLQQFAERDAQIRILTNSQNQGIPTSRNRGIAEMTGEYFCILDQDDLWRTGKAARQVEFLETHPDTMAVACRTQRIDPEGQLLEIRPIPDSESGNLFRVFFAAGMAIPLLSLMFRSQLHETVGGLNQGLKGHDDYEFLLRVANATQIPILPEVLVEQRYQPGTFGQSEAMTLDQINLANILATTWPQYPSLVRRYRSRAHYNVAHFLVSTDRLHAARHHFLQAALNHVGLLKAWWFWTSLYLPDGIRSRLPYRLRLTKDKYSRDVQEPDDE